MFQTIYVIYCIILSSVAYRKKVLLLLSVQMTSITLKKTQLSIKLSVIERKSQQIIPSCTSLIQTLQCPIFHGGLVVKEEYSYLMLIDSKKCPRESHETIDTCKNRAA